MFEALKKIRKGAMIPIGLLMLLAMIVLPLPAFLLDAFFTFNIVLAITVLLVSTTVQRVLDFSVFPTLLLIATLLRLSLNVASTRIILLEGYNGGDSAGQVIEAFGQVVIGGNYIVGMVVFAILMIINFVVITKGGERISEVSARFTLDALPGKQMAIDADMNAGIINQEQAKDRRKEIGNEAEFYGAMDGASKFVRGDAIAGLLILFINLIGGLLIGILSHDLSAEQAFETFALLTIGDGLVAQIPSLLLATSAAIVVTRVSSSDQDMFSNIKGQILASPSVLYSGAAVMAVIGLVPGMPHVAFLSFAILLVFAGWRQSKLQTDIHGQNDTIEPAPLHLDSSIRLEWSDISDVEPIGISLGFKLVKFIESKGINPPELLVSIKGIRKDLSEQVGFLIPEVTIRDDLSLNPEEYVIFIDGEEIARGEVISDRVMAVSAESNFEGLDGIMGSDPAYEMPVLWIEQKDGAAATNFGFQVISVPDVVATHISKIIASNLSSVFNYDDINHLHTKLAVVHPKLAETLQSKIDISLQLQVIRELLTEQVPIKNLKVVANTILESASKFTDPAIIAADVRVSLKRTILNLITQSEKLLNVTTVSNDLDTAIRSAISLAHEQNPNISISAIPIDPNLLQQLQISMPSIAQQMQQQGMVPVLLTSPQIRPLLARYARSFSPELVVISFNEVADEYELNVVNEL
ncbi:flagellar biosynthesis protein FlhA [Vibrio sp.]|nr:flagellar biosynthesis protein FlhA [Vibrio sp.]